MNKAVIFNIQKFCLHDGPGVRTTVFFKGCPLRCAWCHNPESQRETPEILFDTVKCTACGRCAGVCPEGALTIAQGGIKYDPNRCSLCAACIDACLNGAREMAGREITCPELLREIERDRPFFEQSGGGVTFSGGEPMIHADFLREAALACREKGISVAVDTSGYAPFESFQKLRGLVDWYLYDVKLINPGLHEKYVGAGNDRVLSNLRNLCESGENVILRLPLIGGVNDSDGDCDELIRFLKGLRIVWIHLLPYHDMGKSKYRKLSRNEYDFEQKLRAPSEERLDELKARYERAGYTVKTGG